MNLSRVEVYNKFPIASIASVCDQIQSLENTTALEAKFIQYYLVESSDKIEDRILHEIFCDDVSAEFHTKDYHEDFQYDSVVDISFRAGVTDNIAHSAKDALGLFNKEATVSSGVLWLFKGDITLEKLKKVSSVILANNLIQQIQVYSKREFTNLKRFENIKLPKVVLTESIEVEKYNLDLSDSELEKLSTEKTLALTVQELKFIQHHYQENAVQEKRAELGMPVNMPTDVELEVIAQSWSEHCKHKIFSANIQYTEENLAENLPKLGDQKIESLYKTTIKASTKNIEKGRKLDWLVSVFSDNAGIVDFDEKINLCIKVETHNSPSALDPYGGALTGILGVNRDILGVGLGARPIANSDVFCFAPPNYSNKELAQYMPYNLLPSRKIFEGVHAGVEDGGNKSGIPTVNGAIYFDQDFAGKPLVFVGTVGVLPKEVNFNGKARATEEKLPKIGDRIYMIGGAIGADGIHGATFSSLELDENSPATAVQIGDPLTQKRVSDFLLEARDKGLYSSVTDNGAGGLSSSVGEMATMTNGAILDLKLCPTKYPGLKPYELMISESQERMTVAVPIDKINDFEKLAKNRSVSASNIGEFTNSGFLEVFYGESRVAHLDLHFLHDALPAMELTAKYDGPTQRGAWLPERIKKQISSNFSAEEAKQVVTTLLSSPNIASKEKWVRRYDHEVQAATLVKPFDGKTGNGPSNSGVIWLYPHGGKKENCISLGMGMNPRLSQYDTHLMAQYSVDEAVRNVVATGGDIDTLCLLDNFCWPDPVKSQKNPEGEYKLGQLVRACFGLKEIVEAYGTPLVSGKDSMKNDYRGKNNKGENLSISILPTLMVTAMAKSHTNALVTSEFKKADQLIYHIGKPETTLVYSEFSEYFIEESETNLNPVAVDIDYNLSLYRKLFSLYQENCIQSCHDISDGGALISLIESSFGNNVGWDVNIEKDFGFLFSETSGRFIVSVDPRDKEKFEKNIPDALYLGMTTSTAELSLNFHQSHYNWSLLELKNTWLESLS